MTCFDSKTYGVVLAGETVHGTASRPTRQLGPAGRALGRFTGKDVLVVLPGREVRKAANEWASAEGFDVMGLEGDAFEYPNPELYAKALKQIVGRTNPEFVVLPHTMRHCAVAAKVAVHMDAACITAVELAVLDDRNPIFIRSVFGGKRRIGIRPETRRVALTSLPGAFGKDSEPVVKTGEVRILPISETDNSFVPMKMESRMPAGNALKDAEVIVSGGRGMGGEDGIRLLFETAGLFKRSAVGGSRIACDLGWLPHSRQIGETGRSVSPKLYLACGISGASQHLAGMGTSRMIVAVNTDPDAPVFKAAQLGIVEDASLFLPLLIEKYRRLCMA